MLIEYYPADTIVHRLDVRTKALGFIVITAIAFLFEHPVLNLALLVAIWLLLIKIKTPMKNVKKILKPLIPIFIIMILLTGISYSPLVFKNVSNQKVILYIGSLPFTVGGLLFGITLALRIFIMVVASTIITYTTPVEDILQLFKKLKMPHQLAFVIATGIRFIPTMQRKTDMIREAQLARGAKLGTGGLVSRIKSYIPVLIPMIVDSIRMSDNLAVAMLNRGFGAMQSSTDLHEIRMSRRDYLITAIAFIILLLAVYGKSENFGVL